MTTFIIRRFIFLILAIFAATLIVFALSRLQGDPRNVMLNVGYVSPEQWEAWGKQFHLDKPVVVQYLIWIGKGIFQGDFGTSLKTGQPVMEMVVQFAPASLQLGLSATLFVLITGIPIGIMSAVKRGTLLDAFGRTFAVFGQALPPFWLGIMLILVFSVNLDWLPSGTRGHDAASAFEKFKHFVMPAITLGWLASAGLMRLVRSSMLDVLDSEFIKLARAKGVKNRSVIWKHAFKNALIPPLTFSALILVGFIGGTVVTETVFAWPGLGMMTYLSILNNDFPLMTGAVLVFTVVYVFAVFVIDILYAFIDPRIRYN
ncbi:MAG: ABC transporter permease [SAR202 cluster bacterium]|jgi:peptide/nickel transport system permease protein|nr:MAG: ABC transporter permease [SAR202 cluster bacterium]MED5428986.1 ABC transporter permease [Chloroflexota bacterium]MQG75083.1 ABC transporter permease [SAR202 cluster bacterium]|tara:strand:- start:15547 stop:16494 length:948 start_codon:yes stop_codon:yes gene_type:complete